MEEKEYLNLLEKGYSELPEVLFKKERFTIPEVRGRIIKTRTQITNFGEIAKHFTRTQEHFFKFFLKFAGVRGDLDTKKGEVILHSKFQPAFLNKAVKSYFNEYVECPHCNSPDTSLDVAKNMKQCKACGHQEKVPNL
jgi:translation initiation factor 2 subunit 2